MDTSLRFPDWFKLQRSKAGFTQRELADLLGLSARTIVAIESGDSGLKLNPTQYKNLLETFDITPDDLADRFKNDCQ